MAWQAAEALGIGLEELRAAARDAGIREFRAFLRARAAERLKRLRAESPSDPFAWEGPALAAIPPFVEDRAAAESLYRLLRGQAGG